MCNIFPVKKVKNICVLIAAVVVILPANCEILCSKKWYLYYFFWLYYVVTSVSKMNCMGLIILHDKTTGVRIPGAHLSIAVDPSDDLNKIIQQLVFTIDHTLNTALPGCYNELHIACSCSEAGLLLGGGINHNNVAELFKPLRYKVGNIIIHHPGAAFIYDNGNNGVLLCRRLALSVFANVTASASLSNMPADDACKRTFKQSDNFTITATWNGRGKISVVNEYDKNGKVVHSINYPGHNVANLFMYATIPFYNTTKTRSSSGFSVFFEKIHYCYTQLGQYLHTHGLKFIPVKQ